MIYGFLFLTGLIAAMLQSCIGFGAAIMMVNILPIMILPAQAISISQFSCILLSLYIVLKKRNQIKWNVILPMLIPAILCAVVCTCFSTRLANNTLKLMLGILFIILALYFSIVAKKIKLQPTCGIGITMGILSGSLNGLFGMGGPPAVLYLAPALEEKEEYIASSQIFFLLTNLTSLISKLILGNLMLQNLPFMVTCGIGAICGSIVGLCLSKNIKGNLLKRLVYLFIGINGIIITMSCLR